MIIPRCGESYSFSHDQALHEPQTERRSLHSRRGGLAVMFCVLLAGWARCFGQSAQSSLHYELLDGSGYPNRLRGDQVSDIVRLTTIVDIYAALVEKRAYRLPFTHARAFSIMEGMGAKLDQQLLQAFRPVAFGAY